MVDCVADAVDGQTGDIVRPGINAQEERLHPELTLQAFDQCMPPEDITALLTEAFTSSGLPAEQATCVHRASKVRSRSAELAAPEQNDGHRSSRRRSGAAEGCG